VIKHTRSKTTTEGKAQAVEKNSKKCTPGCRLLCCVVVEEGRKEGRRRELEGRERKPYIVENKTAS